MNKNKESSGKNQEKETDDVIPTSFSAIIEDLNKNFPQENTEIFIINTKYDENEKILNIFANLVRETKVNSRNLNINFLILIDEQYPKNPPKVFCLTDVIHNFIKCFKF